MDYLEEQGIELPPSYPNNEEEEEEEEEEDEEEEEQDGDSVDSTDVGGLSGTTSREVLYDNHENDINFTMATTVSQEVVNVDHPSSENANDVTVEVERGCSSQRMGIDDSEGGATASLQSTNDEKNGELNRGEIDGLFCPICFEAWSSGGDHHVCCLPCGHVYGLSCIEKWLHRRGSSKCPQCKKKCGIKDIWLLYATQVVDIDRELQKTVRSLEVKYASLEKKRTEWSKKEVEWKKSEADLFKQVRYLLKLVQETSSSDEGGKQAVEVQAQTAKEEDRWAAIQALIEEIRIELPLMKQENAEMRHKVQDIAAMVMRMHEWHLSQGHYPPPPL